MKKEKILISFLLVFCLSFITACGKVASELGPTTVTFYGWGGDPLVNKWIDEYVATEVKERYDIDLVRVSMNIDEVVTKLSNEKQAKSKKGDMDIIWINGENFNTAKKLGLLDKPFAKELENFKYINENADFVNYDFNVPIEGLEVPFGLSHLVFIANSDVIVSPRNTHELLELIKDNPNMFTYPAPPDFTGSAFVRNIIYDIVGVEAVRNSSNNKEEMEKVIQPALDYLNEIEPYLWAEGKTYPKDEATLQKMYSDKQIFMTMSYTALLAPRNIKDGKFTASSEMFLFDKGNIANAHYLAIPFNAPNNSSAEKVIDFMISPEAQASKLDIDNWGDLSVLSYDRLTTEQKEIFYDTNKGLSALSNDELMQKRLPEVDAEKIAIIEELWRENVLEK